MSTASLAGFLRVKIFSVVGLRSGKLLIGPPVRRRFGVVGSFAGITEVVQRERATVSSESAQGLPSVFCSSVYTGLEINEPRV